MNKIVDLYEKVFPEYAYILLVKGGVQIKRCGVIRGKKIIFKKGGK